MWFKNTIPSRKQYASRDTVTFARRICRTVATYKKLICVNLRSSSSLTSFSIFRTVPIVQRVNAFNSYGTLFKNLRQSRVQISERKTCTQQTMNFKKSYSRSLLQSVQSLATLVKTMCSKQILITVLHYLDLHKSFRLREKGISTLLTLSSKTMSAIKASTTTKRVLKICRKLRKRCYLPLNFTNSRTTLVVLHAFCSHSSSQKSSAMTSYLF